MIRVVLLVVLALLCGALLAAPPALAGGSAETTVLVVNAGSPDSLRVANEWARLRRIPPENVLLLADVPKEPVIPVETFRTRIWKPIRAWLESTGLLEHADLVVYSTGFPYGVDFAADVKAKNVTLDQRISATASLTSMTYLARHVEEADAAEYLDLNANGYFRRPEGGRGAARREATEDESAAAREAEEAIGAGDYARAIAAYERLLSTFPEAVVARYNLACCLARVGRPDDAMAALRTAVEHGWSNAAQTRSDEDLAPLRERKDFLALLESMEARTVAWQPTRGFRSRYAWTGEDEPATEGVSDSRDRYWLSAMLGYTGANGSTTAAVLAYLATAATSDATHPKGTFYFMEHSDVRATTRMPLFPTAIAELRLLGFRAEALAQKVGGQDGVLPCAKDDVAGLVAGIAGFDWAKCGSRILPGAIAEHLTSFGAHFGTPGQTKCTKFLEAGAAGTSGTVAEPYALQEKFPVPHVQVHYARGVSMAEAMYQSVWGPYQLMVLGDPLARPHATFAEVALASPAPAKPWKGEVAVTAALTPAQDHPVAAVELWVDGRYVGESKPGEPIAWDTTKSPDGSLEVRLVAVEAGPIETRSSSEPARVRVQNGAASVRVQVPRAMPSLDGTLKVSGGAKGCATVEVRRGTNVLATSPAKSGSWKAEVPASALGAGVVLLHAEGVLADGRRVRSDPFEVRIDAPKAKPTDKDGDKGKGKDKK